MVTKEINNITAADLVAKIVSRQVYSNYQPPEDKSMQSASLIYVLNGEYGKLSMRYLYDLWAHFLTVPDYLLAKESGKFARDNQKLLGTWEIAANMFRNNGLIAKGKDGKYEYLQGSTNFYNAWFQAAADIYPMVHS